MLSRLLFSLGDFRLDLLEEFGVFTVDTALAPPPPWPLEWEVPLILQNSLLTWFITPKPPLLIETHTQR